uniref:PARP catalytic domain-containing protein n=1 Tax=Gadus morhua TaxID=8049 RepID=A0A8C5FA87_GADMO
MYHHPSYLWKEDDFQLPYGVRKCGHGQPNCGQTYVMYHGTTRTKAKAIRREGFRQSTDGMLGGGVYLSRDLNKARKYPIGTPDSQRAVIRVKVRVGNVIAINYQGHPRRKNWHDSRYGKVYDTAWCPPDCGMTRSGMEEDCVWDPSRITIAKCIIPTRASAFTRICAATNSLELKYFNFDANFV